MNDIITFYKKYPNFDFNYYIKLNNINVEKTKLDYLKKYDKLIDKKDIITNLQDFYKKYPKFDIFYMI